MFRGLDDNNENEKQNLEIKKDFLEFYKKYCNPASKLQPKDIYSFNLVERKIFGDYHNDLAYLTRNHRLIILFEHQSTENPNMPEQLFIYYSKLLNKYIKENNINLKENKKIKLPAPELYVIEVFNSKNFNTTTKDSLDSVRIVSMFDENEFINRELIRFDTTILHFNTEKVYQEYLNGKKPEDLIHEFSLYYAANKQELSKLLSQDSDYISLSEKQLNLATILKNYKKENLENEKKKKLKEKKKTIEKQMAELRNHYKNIAAKNVIKKFQKEKIFIKILERMGEINMVNATIAVNDDEEDKEALLAETFLNFVRERERANKVEERANKAEEEINKERERANKAEEELEKLKKFLNKTMNTFD